MELLETFLGGADSIATIIVMIAWLREKQNENIRLWTVIERLTNIGIDRAEREHEVDTDSVS